MIKSKFDEKISAKVVLSGGAALGLAEIGVMAVLEERFNITGIIGTSIGAIIGGLYAAGKSPQEMLKLAQSIDKKAIFNPLDLDFKLSGIFDGKAIHRLFREFTLDAQIEDLRIPYRAVAYDLNKQNTIIISSGILADAMRASASIPYLFSPFVMGQYCFVDGGVEYPLALGIQDNLSGDITIAVNVLPTKPHTPEEIDINEEDKIQVTPKLHEVFLRSVIQNQAFLAMHALVDNPPDLVVEAWYPEGKVFAFDYAQTFFEWGVMKAKEALLNYDHSTYFIKVRKKYKKLIELIKTTYFYTKNP